MPLKLTQPIRLDNQQLYDNDIKNFSGFYFDNLSVKTVSTQAPWTSIAINDNNGHTLSVGNTSSSSSIVAMMYSIDGGESWSPITLSSGTNNWKSVVFGGGKFVAVSASGTTNRVACSSGANMSAPVSNSDFTFTSIQNNNWESVTYGNGYFIAVANSGTNRVMTSINGTSWTIVDKSFLNTNPWESITYSNELRRFVAVASNGKIVYADFNGDADSWKEASNFDILGNQITVSFNQVIWSSKLKNFIAVGNSGEIRRSIDGQTWIKIISPTSLNLISIIWSQELEILSIIASSGRVAFTAYTLDDLNISWTTRSLLYSGTTWSYGVWNRYFGSFIIVSSAGSSDSERILSSKISGIKHFLEKKYYYDLIQLLNSTTFQYSNDIIRTSIQKTVKVYPLLSELLNLTYSSLDTLPDGITLNSSTGEITIFANKKIENKTYRIFALSDTFSLKSSIQIYVSDLQEVITDLEYTENYLSTDLIDFIKIYPIFTKGTDYIFTFSVLGINNFNSLPKGITFNPYNGLISGLPKEIQQTIPYRITMTSSNSSFFKDITITVYLLKTFMQSGVSRGNVSTDGEWLGYVSYFYSNRNVIGGTIEKNYFFNDKGTLSYSNILTIATKRSLIVINGISFIKKDFVFTVIGNYNENSNLLNWTSININSYTFNLQDANKFYDQQNNYSIFSWTIDEKINYFPIKNNLFYITGKSSSTLSIQSLSGLSYGSAKITLTGSTVSYKPTLSQGFGIEYKISPNLTDGLSLNTITGEIFGTTSFISSNNTYTITSINSVNSVNTSLQIRIVYFNSTLTLGKAQDNSIIGYKKDLFGSFNNSNLFKNSNILELSIITSSNGTVFNGIRFKVNKEFFNDDLSSFKRLIWNDITYQRTEMIYSVDSNKNTEFFYNGPTPPFNIANFISSQSPSSTLIIIE